jgi:hypothetical protein
MIILVGASALFLTAAQAGINAPRQAFWACAKAQKSKARDQKVGGDGFEAFLRNGCGSEIQSLRSAIAATDVKNGMAHKAAEQDADSSMADYVSGPVDSYKADLEPPPAATAPPAASAAAKPANPSSQPHNP